MMETVVLLILVILTGVGWAFAGAAFLMCFIGFCDNIVEHFTTKNTCWDILKRIFLVGCVSGTIGCLFAGIIYFIK